MPAIENPRQPKPLSQIEDADVTAIPLERNDGSHARRIHDKIPTGDAKRQILHAFSSG